MRDLDQPAIAPLCAVSRSLLARHTAASRRISEAAEEAREQLRFERICARELLGEID